jgi:hypothetical protein
MNRNWGGLWFITLTSIMVYSCSSNTSSVPASSSGSQQTPAAANAITYADGWSEVSLQANYAKTFIDSTGHYMTDRNACGQAANGAIDLAIWNKLVVAINSAIKAPLAAPPTGSGSAPSSSPQNCPVEGDNSKMDGTMSVTLESGKQMTIFENLGPGEVCTSIADHQIAQNLYDAINVIVVLADQTDCARH